MRIEDVSHEAHAHRILVRLRYLIVAFSFIGLYLRFVDEIYIVFMRINTIGIVLYIYFTIQILVYFGTNRLVLFLNARGKLRLHLHKSITNRFLINSI